MMIAEPGFELVFTPAETDGVTWDVTSRSFDPHDYLPALQRALERTREVMPARTPLHLSLRDVVPRHAGLGSGTQLAAAVAVGVARSQETTPVDAAELARWTGRGRRSTIGLYGFLKGGFLVDVGRTDEQVIGDLAARESVPKAWRVVLVTPQDATGLNSEAESKAFASLPPTTEAHEADLARRLHEEILPSVRTGDFERFAEALYEYGRLVGESFAPVQSGTYSHPETAAIVSRLRAAGVRGVGQTSWGPTVFAFAPDPDRAESLADEVRTWVAADTVVRLVRPMNQAATVETLSG